MSEEILNLWVKVEPYWLDKWVAKDGAQVRYEDPSLDLVVLAVVTPLILKTVPLINE